MKRILIVHENPEFQGGAEQHIFDLSYALKEHYFLDYLTFGQSDNRSGYLSPYDKVYSIPKNLPSKQIEEFASKAMSKANVIYLHKCQSIPLLSTIVGSKTPCIHMVHDHESYCLRKSRLFPLTDGICHSKAPYCCLFPGLCFIERNSKGSLQFHWKSIGSQRERVELEKQADRIIVASQYMKKSLLEQNFNENKIFCHFGIKSSLKEETFQQREQNTLLFVGQIVRGKGLHSLISSLRHVKVPWKLTVIGSGSDLNRCQELAKKMQIDRSIQFEGFLPHEQVKRHYEKTAVGIVPSIWPEPFGMVGPEMLLSGMPVIGYDSGGIGEWLQDGVGGYLIPRMNEEVMAEKITNALKNPEKMEEMGKKGRERIKEKYAFERYVDQIREIIDSL